MCGIAGIVGKGATDHHALVRSMLALMFHRGPDESATEVVGEHAVLGTARLAIVDPQHGHQPLRSTDGGVAVVCNGEIYGHHRLRRELRGYSFSTGSDCELLIPLFLRDGTDFVDHLPGTFSFALWDSREQHLILARDRFGERPLYWTRLVDGCLAFASEADPLRRICRPDATLNRRAVAHMLRQGYVPDGSSIWAGVHAIPHGGRLDWQLDRSIPTITRWWSPPDPEPRGSTTAEAATEWFADTLDRAVRDQLVADVPVGAFLSGGVDSTTIALLAARHHPELHAFAYDMPEDSEIEYARAVAEQHGITLHEYRPDESDVATELDDLTRWWDEPFGDSSALPTAQLCAFARDHVTVSLTGDGADELLGGYLAWTRPMLEQEDLPGTRSHGARPRRSRRDATTGEPPPPRPGSDVARRYRSFREYFDSDALTALGLPPVEADDIDVSAYSWGGVADISRFDLDHYLPGDILVKTDRASMSKSLEVRSPFLDREVAEGCLRLSFEHHHDDTREKLLLHRAFAHEWPTSLSRRSKQGFGAPMQRWLALPDVAALKHDVLVDPRSALFDIVEHRAVQSIVDGNDQRTWNLFVLGLWWSHHRASTPPKAVAHRSGIGP
ncbi:MAG: asparagine synthase (glutamine-hydrolyzing) [Microthrixaceae bacterium]